MGLDPDSEIFTVFRTGQARPTKGLIGNFPVRGKAFQLYIPMFLDVRYIWTVNLMAIVGF